MTYLFMASPGSGGTFMRHFLELKYAPGNLECNKGNKVLEPLIDCYLIAHHICMAATTIKNNLPDMKIIHLTRNGLDVVNSRITRDHTTSSHLENRTKKELNIEDEKLHIQFAKLWKNDIKEATKLRGYENYLEIEYEEFCNNPEKVVKQIEEFLGITNYTSLQYLKDSLKPSIGNHKNLPKEILQDIKKIIGGNDDRI